MMQSRRSFTRTLAGLAAAVGAAPVHAGPPAARVVVLSTTDREWVQPLIDDFERGHGLKVEYRELGSVELNQHFLRDVAAARPDVDVLWSSAMDLQVKLVNDGHAQAHESRHEAALPPWAVWKREAFGTTFEPIGVAWNRAALGSDAPPATHAELRVLLEEQQQRLRGRVCTYDIQNAGLGYLVAAQDAAATPTYWDLVRALGACRARLYANTSAMLAGVRRGDMALAYNVLGPYARGYARRHPEVSVGFLRDYTLVISRVAFISRRAPRPEAARLWLDHLLSQRGQALLAQVDGLYAVRDDVEMPHTVHAARSQLGESARPIALSPGLMAHLDRSVRTEFLKRWQREVSPGS